MTRRPRCAFRPILFLLCSLAVFAIAHGQEGGSAPSNSSAPALDVHTHPTYDVRARRDSIVDANRFETRRRSIRTSRRRTAIRSVLRGLSTAGKVGSAGATAVAESDSLALVELYEATSGDQWIDDTGWTESGTPVSEWAGVTVEDGRVRGVELPENGLSGTLPASLADLTALRVLDLYDNHLAGSLDGLDWADLTELRMLDLGGNGLSGSIPVGIGDLANLVHLGLSHNDLSGELPSEIGQLDQLEVLAVRGNRLDGAMPSSIGDVRNLELLDLGGNRFGGSIRPEIGSLDSLTSLVLDDNQLTGSIPPELAELGGLEELILSGNALTGEIPDETTGLTALRRLDLARNELTGELPPSIGSLANLEELSLESNSLTGSLPAGPDGLGALTSLRYLDLEDNQFAGTIPSSLGNLSALVDLELGGNQLEGTIPGSLGDLSQVADFSLGRNQLTGAIPPELGNLGAVQWFDLRENELTGPVPEGLTDLPRVRLINLFGNTLDGGLPETIRAWGELRYFYAGSNELSGSIPSVFGSLGQLRELWLPANRISGTVPASFSDLANLRVIALGGNELSGPFPGVLTQMAGLTEVYLTSNRFDQSIPADLGQLERLRTVRLGGNRFEGSVPAAISQLTRLRVLHLDYNRLAGLPDLSALPHMQELRVRRNTLSFSDLVPNTGAVNQYTYAPQDSIGDGASRSISSGDSLVLEVGFEHPDNEYRWFKDGTAMAGATDPTLEITDAATSDAGTYRLEVTNSRMPDLTLTSVALPVDVDSEGGGTDGGSDGGGSDGDGSDGDGSDGDGSDGDGSGGDGTNGGDSSGDGSDGDSSGGDSGGSSGGGSSGEDSGDDGEVQLSSPELVAPSSGAESVWVPLTLTWSSVPSATGYDVQVATSTEFDAPVSEAEGLEATEHVLTELDPDSSYVWRVRAVTGASTGPWSAVRSFASARSSVVWPSPPALSVPSKRAAAVDTSLALEWSPQDGATKYGIQLASDSTFDHLVVDDVSAEASLEVTGLEGDATYHWRVRTITELDTSSWSASRSFRTRSSRSSSSTERIQGVPRKFELAPNYPNPFNPSTTIRFGVPRVAPVRIEIYDRVGRRVDLVLDRDLVPPGRYEVTWDAGGLPSGAYFYRLVSEGRHLARRMTLVK